MMQGDRLGPMMGIQSERQVLYPVWLHLEAIVSKQKSGLVSCSIAEATVTTDDKNK